jgi:hypothetical protein
MNKLIKSLLLTTSLLMVNPTSSHGSDLDMNYEKPYFKSTQLSSLENIIVPMDRMPVELEEKVVPYILNSRKTIAAEVIKYFEGAGITWNDECDFTIHDFDVRAGGIDRAREAAIGKVMQNLPTIDMTKEYKYWGGARQFVFTGQGAIIPGFQDND